MCCKYLGGGVLVFTHLIADMKPVDMGRSAGRAGNWPVVCCEAALQQCLPYRSRRPHHHLPSLEQMSLQTSWLTTINDHLWSLTTAHNQHCTDQQQQQQQGNTTSPAPAAESLSQSGFWDSLDSQMIKLTWTSRPSCFSTAFLIKLLSGDGKEEQNVFAMSIITCLLMF